MPHILTDFFNIALIRALDANLIDYVKLFGLVDGAELYDSDDMLRLFTPSVPSPFFNSVMRAQFTPETMPGLVDEVMAFYAEQSQPMMWWTSSYVLGEYLQSRGFTLEQTPSMMLDLQRLLIEPTNPALHIERVNNDRMLQDWIKVNTTPYDFLHYVNDAFFQCYSRYGYAPDAALHHYVGYVRGEAVACSSLLYGGGIAVIYSVAILPEYRRKGFGTAITLRPLIEARERGYRIAMLNASPEGYGVYQRMGFKPAGATRMYLYDTNLLMG